VVEVSTPLKPGRDSRKQAEGAVPLEAVASAERRGGSARRTVFLMLVP
jgi:hypothetical protein